MRERDARAVIRLLEGEPTYFLKQLKGKISDPYGPLTPPLSHQPS